MKRVAVVALGGHAILPKVGRLSIERQFVSARRAMRQILSLASNGWNLVLSHGNGPQVGNILIQVESAMGKAYPVPLSVAVAESEGEIGYVIQQSLYNELSLKGLERLIITVLTQVLVDMEDPAFSNPSKPIGPFYGDTEARELARKGIALAHFPEVGWRRIVPSPRPIKIIEAEAIRRLVAQDIVVIAAGGGGIPVSLEQGQLRGVDAVVDKDLASAVLARDVEAELFMILTDVPKVVVNYGKPNSVSLDRLTVSEARWYSSEGHFPPGSMGPKIEAAVQFVKESGRSAIITSPAEATRAMGGRGGTLVVP